MASFLLKELAEHLKAKLHGDGELPIQDITGLAEAGPNDLSFLYSSAYLKLLGSTKAGAVLVTPEYAHLVTNSLVVDNPRLSLCKALALFTPPDNFISVPSKAFIHHTAQVDPSAEISPFVVIGAQAVIEKKVRLYPGVYIGENAHIGEESVLRANVVVERDCIIGKRVLLNANTTIGAEGFGFVTEQGRAVKIPHLKKVIIADDVEVGANSAIDRGSMLDTKVGRGTKIDNLVQIGHNVRLGENNIISGQSGICGSVTTGRGVVILAKAIIADNLQVPDDLVLGPFSCLTRSPKKPGGVYCGYPARRKEEWVETTALTLQLKRHIKKILALEKKVEALAAELLKNQKGNLNRDLGT